jgi:catechol 1,2-dioxygenase
MNRDESESTIVATNLYFGGNFMSKNFTERVLRAYENIDNPRLKEVMQITIKHLHAMVEEIKPDDQEFEIFWRLMEKMAASTGPERNEFLLFCDVVGISQLVEIVNHDKPDQKVGYALVGPFLRENDPFRSRGEADMSDDTPGDRVLVSGRVYDIETNEAIPDAVVDTWQAAMNGLYENQDSHQPDYNLRGKYKTDSAGTFELVALFPTAYPVPTDGPVGEILAAAHRYPYRPAHIHFICTAPGYETLITQVFVKGDKQIEDDVVFTASDKMIGNFQKGDGKCKYKLTYDLPLRKGVSTIPKAPIPA